ncbi:hypothetical protein DITRI_Ditri05aG0128600 [Diplodiscus trichospermus]
MAKPSVTDEERSRQEQQRPNHMRRPSVLPDVNLLSLPPQHATDRPDENALIPSDLPDSKSSSDDEVVDGEENEDDGDIADDENEELQREILLIREELQILQKLLGLDAIEIKAEEAPENNNHVMLGMC